MPTVPVIQDILLVGGRIGAHLYLPWTGWQHGEGLVHHSDRVLACRHIPITEFIPQHQHGLCPGHLYGLKGLAALIAVLRARLARLYEMGIDIQRHFPPWLQILHICPCRPSIQLLQSNHRLRFGRNEAPLQGLPHHQRLVVEPIQPLPGRLRRWRPVAQYACQSSVVPQTLHVIDALTTQCTEQYEALHHLAVFEPLARPLGWQHFVGHLAQLQMTEQVHQ